MFLKKNIKGFSEDEYEKLIKEYLNNDELHKLKNKLKELNQYSLKTDQLFFNTKRDKYYGKINYIVKELPSIKRDTKTKKIVKSVSKKKSIRKN